MSFPFDPYQGLIIVPADVVGPAGSAVLRLALDTAATGTLINAAILITIGYDLALAPERFQVTTGSGVECVPRIALDKITALGQERVRFSVLCHTLPPSTGIDGVLGLDFLRGRTLTVDFRSGRMNLG